MANDDTFTRSHDLLQIQDMFSEREVGVTHPDVSSHLRLRDNGDVELISGEGLGLVFHRKTRTITLVADNIRFLTKDAPGGLRWNKLAFNDKATSYEQPTFKVVTEHDSPNVYRGVDVFMGDD